MLLIRDKKSKKHLIRALIALLIGILLLLLKNVIKDKNASDFVVILGVAFCILAVWFYYKSLNFTMETIIKPALKKAFGKILKSVKNTVGKIKKKLGISDKTWRMRGTDTFNFVFPSWSKKKGDKKDFKKSRIKWNEDPSNPWKIRYIYTKYIVKKVKKGMRFKSSATALENENTVGSCPYPEIFELYTVSRYAPKNISNEAITDQMVDEAMEKLIK